MTTSTRMKAVKAIVWKEWRENVKWALLMCASFGALLCYMVRQAPSSMEGNRELVRLWQSTQPLTVFVLPLLAGVLGFLQVSSELRRDQWAILMHRPATRGTIFWGKAFAGLSLYGVAAALPYLLFAWWMSAPGNVPAPFDSRLVWPGLVMLTLGIPFYFAGVLTAVRVKPWFGSRMLAVPAAFVIALGLSTASDWEEGAIITAAYVIFIVAALGSFQTTGRWNRQSRIAQGALTSILLTGLVIVAVLFITFTESLIPKSDTPRTTHAYLVTEKGLVFRTQSTSENDANDIVTDLNGRVLARGSARSTFLYKENKMLDFISLPLQEDETSDTLGDNVFNRNFISLTSYSYEDDLWYFERAKKRLVGFSRRDNTLIGYIGSNGFHCDAAQVKPFDESLTPTNYYGQLSDHLVFSHSIWAFDAKMRVVRQKFASSSVITGAVRSDRYGESVSMDKRSIAVWTKDDQTLHLLSPQGRKLWSRRVNVPNDDKARLSVAQNLDANRFWVMLRLSDEEENVKTFSQTLISLDKNGKMLKEQSLPPLPARVVTTHWSEDTVFLATPPIVPIGYSFYAVASNQTLAQAISDIASGETPEQERVRSRFLIVALLLSTIVALLAYLRARRYSFPTSTRWAWTLGVFLLGPLGLPLMIALLDWPTLEKCSSCGKLRNVSHEKCQHCGVAVSTSPHDGTEIYDNATP